MHSTKKEETLIVKLLLVATVALFFIFGSIHLTKFITADEHYWTDERVPQYWNAIENFKLKKTLINDKPGITIAMISGIGLLFEKNPADRMIRIDADLKTFDTSKTERINLAFRLPILIFNGLLLFYLFWIIKKVAGNEWIAIWSTILIALSPILIGISQIVNPDALLWSFSLAAILSYLALLKHPERKYIFLSSFFLAMSLLAKYVSSILIPFFILTLTLWIVFKVIPAHNRITALKIIRKNLYSLSYIIFITIIFLSIFLPAIWLNPSILQVIFSGGGSEPLCLISVLALIFIFTDILLLKGKVLFLIQSFSNKGRYLEFAKKIISFFILILFTTLMLGRFFYPDWNLFERIPFDLKDPTSNPDLYGPYPTLLEMFLLQANPLVFSLTPITLLLFLILLGQQLFMKESRRKWEFEILSLLTLILLYLSALIFFDVLAIPRYLIMLYPTIAFLAAIGLWRSKSFLKEKLSFIKSNLIFNIIITSIIITFSLISLFLIRPFYFNYTNFVLPKNNLISSAWGYGGYEAAEYLNTLPDAKNITIWTDYHGVCEFFIGKCITDYIMETGKYSIDYFVLTNRGRIRYLKSHIKWENKPTGIKAAPYYNNSNSLWKLEIDEHSTNYIRILKAN